MARPPLVCLVLQATLGREGSGTGATDAFTQDAAGGAGAGQRAAEEAELAEALAASLEEHHVATSSVGHAAGAKAVPRMERHFVGDTFWLLLRSVGTGVGPALQELEMLEQSERRLEPHSEQHRACTLRANALLLPLLSPELLGGLLQLYGFVGVWLQSMLARCDKGGEDGELAAAELAQLPEHVLDDMAAVLKHALRRAPRQLANHAEHVQAALSLASAMLQGEPQARPAHSCALHYKRVLEYLSRYGIR